MTKVVQHSFLGGQLDFEMMGRQDIEKYAKGATALRNFIPLKRGALRKRPGTEMLHDVTSRAASATARRLVPFAYRQSEGWALLFTPGAVLAVSRSATVEVSASGGADFYTAEQIAALDYCQSGDVMFIAERTHAPCRIEHRVEGGAHTFTLAEMDFGGRARGVPTISGAKVRKQAVVDCGGVVTERYVATAVYDGVETNPSSTYSKNLATASYNDYGDEADSWRNEYKAQQRANALYNLNVVHSAPAVEYASTSYHAPWTESQTIELTVDVPSRDEGGVSVRPEQIRIYRKSGTFYGLVGHVKVPASGGTVKWVDNYYSPDVSQTPPKPETAMAGPGEWPGCVCLSQQRLVWASTANEPSRVMMSQVGDFYTYAPHDAITEDDPIDFKVAATRFPAANHLVEMRKLLLFNGDSEWVVDSASASAGMTYATIQAHQHSCIGAAAWLKPLVCGNVMLFAERTGQAVRQYGYQLEDDGYGGVDVSIFSSSLFRWRKIASWAFQQHPHSTCWCVLSDGEMCSLTFMPEQQTVAWAAHALGGGGLARGVVCTHALVGSGELKDTTEMFLLVERGGVWTVEAMRCDCAHGGDTVWNALALDSMRTLGAGDALRAGEVAVDPATGAVRGEGAAEAGDYAGYPFESVFTSVYPVVAEAVGLSQMDVKCVQEAHLRVVDAVGGTVRAATVPKSEASRLERTGLRCDGAGGVTFAEADENVPLVTDNSRDGRVTVEQGEPWPFTLLMLESDLELERVEN